MLKCSVIGYNNKDKILGKEDNDTQYIISESFQDYSQIQNFEADFPPQKVSLKILNLEDYYNKSFSDILSVYRKVIVHFNLKVYPFCWHAASFKVRTSEVQAF